ncbi:MAG: aminoacetone oxidase family FAD-binding enzyme [Lachnospiraceae bacterium]|nr:aminoacetone oxidase family FAD-binding enzyme [Lachnospiraceae bacterium]
MKQIAIIGGGAAGIMAAITAASQGGDVTIFERNDRPGKKILATGNGKCNLGNLQMSEQDYYCGNKDFVKKCLDAFGTEDTIRFFNGIGLLLKEKNGYLYPLCEQASAVLDALCYELESLRVKVLCNVCVEDISIDKYDKFHVSYAGQKKRFDKLIITTGGRASIKKNYEEATWGYSLARSLGHRIINQVPALGQLKCSEKYMKQVAGVRCDAFIKAYADNECIAEERGELQITEYGVSGIPIFQLSRTVNYSLVAKKSVSLRIDLLPDMNDDSIEQMILSRNLLQSDRSIRGYFNGILNHKLNALFIKLAGLSAEDDFCVVKEKEPAKIEKFFELTKNWELHVYDHNGFENAQVCAGGISLDDIKDNMESEIVPNLYFAGEILDVDGRCGGYNLQWAWTSGYLAGLAAAKD